MFGLNYIIFRPHNVYGDRQNIADPYRNVIGIFMRQILENNPITIFGDGQQKRAFSYISDVAPIIAKSIDRPETWNTVYNVGADQPWTVLELATQVCKSMGQSTPNIQFLNSRNEVQVAYSSHEKIKRVFGDMIENVPLGVGIQRMADWVKSQHHFRPVKIFQDVEVRRNMPASWARLLKRD
jgi:UDP-glucose 4-epimerase